MVLILKYFWRGIHTYGAFIMSCTDINNQWLYFMHDLFIFVLEIPVSHMVEEKGRYFLSKEINDWAIAASETLAVGAAASSPLPSTETSPAPK